MFFLICHVLKSFLDPVQRMSFDVDLADVFEAKNFQLIKLT